MLRGRPEVTEFRITPWRLVIPPPAPHERDDHEGSVTMRFQSLVGVGMLVLLVGLGVLVALQYVPHHW
jgi:hypothetical protein